VATSDDRPALQAFFHDLSPTAKRRRFFAAVDPPEELVARLADSRNPRERLTLIVMRTVGTEPRIVATGSYVACDPSTAEVAFAVDDAFQGKGLGTLLLERLAILAIRHGFTRFRALTMWENTAMLDVFRTSGFRMRTRPDGGDVEIDLDVLPSQASVSFAEMRDRVATEASLRPFFEPRAVAIVGASRRHGSIGFRILEALVRARFAGAVYPINPSGARILDLASYRSVRDVPGPVDLAVVAVPRDAVPGAVDECAAAGVRAIVAITAGFAEVGGAGRAAEDALAEQVRGHGMRLVGPNCMGLLNTDPAVRLNASFSPVFPPPGPIAMLSQSGALGLAILALAEQRALGLSTFVSVGNKADVSGNDLLQYWENDPRTGVILLYLESFGNPRRFARIARRVARTKPIVSVKGGRTRGGSRAAGSHTAALAASDVAVDALFRQAGVIRADTLDEMFDLAACLGSQPLPAGPRVGIVTNAGGPGILCVDACETLGLVVPELSETTRAALAAFLPPVASMTNPVDMIASAGPEQYQRAVETVLGAPEVDALIVIHTPVDLDNADAIVAAIGRGVTAGRTGAGATRPVLACLLATEGVLQPLRLPGELVPVYAFPESAARVLSKATAYADWRREPPGVVPQFDGIDAAGAAETCRRALASRGDGWLAADEARSVLEAFGLPVLAGGFAATADESIAIAERVGFPVAVKLASLTLIHKTDVGGVALGLGSADDVRRAFDAMRGRLAREGRADAMAGVVVQPMVSGGIEVMVGVTEDPLFGPLVGFGLGGIHVEVLRDVTFRVTPLDDRDAARMVREIRGFPLLEGFRGHPPADVPAIEDVLLRVSRLVEELPEVTELDLNPVFALPPGRGCRIADARVRVSRPIRGQPPRYTLTAAAAPRQDDRAIDGPVAATETVR
jgi:acetyl coenzyme A synthetase (ADP forming)-like protein